MRRKPRFLIADDEPSVLLTLGLIFEQDGNQIVKAESAAEALQALHRSGPFDVVLTDLCMEREDVGLEVAAAAAQLFPRPIIVVLTGFSSVTNAQAALHLRIDYYAIKPIEADELKAVIHHLLEKGKERQARVGR